MGDLPRAATEEQHPRPLDLLSQHVRADAADFETAGQHQELWWRGEHRNRVREVTPTEPTLGFRADMKEGASGSK